MMIIAPLPAVFLNPALYSAPSPLFAAPLSLLPPLFAASPPFSSQTGYRVGRHASLLWCPKRKTGSSSGAWAVLTPIGHTLTQTQNTKHTHTHRRARMREHAPARQAPAAARRLRAAFIYTCRPIQFPPRPEFSPLPFHSVARRSISASIGAWNELHLLPLTHRCCTSVAKLVLLRNCMCVATGRDGRSSGSSSHTAAAAAACARSFASTADATCANAVFASNRALRALIHSSQAWQCG